MGVYRVIINGKDTGHTVTANSMTDAYTDLPSLSEFSAGEKIQLQEVEDLDIGVVGFMMVDLPSDNKDPIFPIR